MDKKTGASSPGAVLIADDHEVTRFGLGQLMRASLGAERVLEAERFESALAQIGEKDLGLAVVDLCMPGLPGPHALAEIRRRRPDVKLVVLSASSDREDILGCLAAGVHGYLVKTESLDELTERLRLVLDGYIYVPPILAELDAERAPATSATREPPPVREAILERLTPRQRSVLRCLEKGMTNKEIGRELSITHRTVKMHLAAIYPVLGVHNRTQAAAAVRGLLSDAGTPSDSERGGKRRTGSAADQEEWQA